MTGRRAVFVGNLPNDVDADKLRADFATVGDVAHVDAAWLHVCVFAASDILQPFELCGCTFCNDMAAVEVRHKTHQATATVRYSDPSAAAAAVDQWNHTYYAGRRIIVEYARRG